MAATRGICGVCGREVRVREDGKLWRHGYLAEGGPRTCSGSGYKPENIVGDIFPAPEQKSEAQA